MSSIASFDAVSGTTQVIRAGEMGCQTSKPEQQPMPGRKSSSSIGSKAASKGNGNQFAPKGFSGDSVAVSGHSQRVVDSASDEPYAMGHAEGKGQGMPGMAKAVAAKAEPGEERYSRTSSSGLPPLASHLLTTGVSDRTRRSSIENSKRPSGSRGSSFENERASIDVFRRDRDRDNKIVAPNVVNDDCVPEQLKEQYLALGVVPAETPVPAAMLGRLWGTASASEAAELISAFEALRVVRTAVLDDGSLWALPANEHLQFIGERHAEVLPNWHDALVNAYTGNGARPIQSIADDGYILQNVGYHLFHSERLDDLRILLMEPCWLEAKLHAYGVGAVVSDFRRYLQNREDAEVKLLLQAFQLSLGCCVENPGSSMLREQMLGRTMEYIASIGAPPGLKGWYDDQYAKSYSVAARCAGVEPVHLLPRTATLQQAGGLHRITLRGHGAAVRQMVISANAQDVITVAGDGTAQVWDLEIGDCVMQLGRKDPLTSVDVTPDGRLCVVGSQGGPCCVWDLVTGQIKTVLEGHTARVNALVVDRQGLRVVTVSEDSTARVWDLHSGRCEHVLRGHGENAGAVGSNIFDVALSADGVVAATVSEDFTVRVWDLDDGDCVKVLEGHNGWVVSVSFVGETYKAVTASHDATARIWDAWGGSCLHTLVGHEGRLNKVCVDASGSRAVTGSDDFTARVWNTKDGVCLQVLVGHNGWITDLAITRDGTRVVTVSGDCTGRVWDTESGNVLKVLEGHSKEVRTVVVTRKGRFAITSAEDCTTRVWDLHAPDKPSADAHGRVKRLLALPDGMSAISTGDDGQLRVWSVADGSCIKSMSGHDASPPGYLATTDSGEAVSGSNDRKVCRWNVATGRSVATMPAQQGSRVKSMSFDGQGRLAAVVLFDSTVTIWNIDTADVKCQLIRRGERDASRVHSGGVNAVYLTRDGTTAITISKDATARVWDVGSGNCRLVLRGHSDGLDSACLSADENVLATCSYDATARIWDMAGGQCLVVLTHNSPVTNVWLAPNCGYVVTLTDDKVAWLWQTATGTLIGRLQSNKDEVEGVLFSADSRFVVTYSGSGSVCVWSTADAHARAIYMADTGVTSCCFGGGVDADVLVVGDANGLVHLVDFPSILQM